MPRTEFVHSIDGFAFGNNWDMQASDWDQLRGIIQGAATGLSFDPLVSAIIGPLLFAIPPGPPFSNLILGKIVADQIVGNVNPGDVGLCGGMTFAAADYFGQRWLPPRGEFASGDRRPGWATPEESTIRRYIWTRLLDSLVGGGVAVQTLTWMGVIHNIFPFSTLGGASWLHDRSREQFAAIKRSIDSGRVCPIGLVGTTPNAMNNHQVLVTGYEDPGPLGANSCRLYVYEPNGPNAEQTIDYDFSGAQLPHESVGSGDRGVLQGFFTAQYTATTPAPAIVVTAGLSTSSANARIDESVQLNMTVKNVGFGDTPELKLFIAGRAGTANVDAGAEPAALRLAMHAPRPFSKSQIMAAPAGERHYFASTSVEPARTPGKQAWRLPAASAPGNVNVNMFVGAPASGWDSLGGILRSEPSAASSPDGRIHIFAIGLDNNLWVLPQSGPGGAWGGFARTRDAAPAGLGGRPFVMLDRDGLFHVFCRGLDAQVWHTRQSVLNGALEGWEGLGGSTPSDPSATFNSDGRLEAFIQQRDHTAGHRWVSPLGWWPPAGGWESRAGALLGSPAVARNADGRLEVFARFNDNTLRHIWQTSPGGGWSDWAPFGTGVTNDPSVGVNGDGRLEVLCVAGGTVWQRWQTVPSGAWSAWVDMRQPAAANTRIALLRNTFGGMEAFVRTPDNAIWTAGFRPGPTWTPWRSLGGAPNGDPAAALNSDGRVDVFVRGTDGSLQQRMQVAGATW